SIPHTRVCLVPCACSLAYFKKYFCISTVFSIHTERSHVMTLRSSANSSMRAWRRYFPLVSMESVTDLFEEMLQGSHISDASSNCSSTGTSVNSEPNLAFISIILGYIETHITTMSCPVESVQKPKSDLVNSRKRIVTGKSNRSSKRPNLRPSSPTIGGTESSALGPSVVEIPSDASVASISVSCCESPAPAVGDAIFSTDSEVLTPIETKCSFPVLRYEEVELLYQKFYSMIVNHPKLASLAKINHDQAGTKKETVIPESMPSNRRLVKLVCDILCAHMSSGRQREHLAHAQSIYSLLKNGQLDSFGLAYTTVAACQLLGYTDVHLALSEDHAWVEFGPPDRRETADVSVMPALEPGEAISPQKAPLDANSTSFVYPPPVRLDHLLNSWLYLNGYPVVCNPLVLSVAAAVTAIQPCGLSKSVRPQEQVPKRSRLRTNSVASADSPSPRCYPGYCVETISPQLVQLKQNLLWIVYRAGLLNQYPLGLTNLADIEEGYPSGVRLEDLPGDLLLPSSMYPMPEIVEVCGGIATDTPASIPPDVPLSLLRRAVEIDRVYFQNQHVYPYIYLANYLYRRGDLIGALRYWAEAGRVIGQYNHSSEDAEIYREFLDIATRVIPDMFKSFSVENRTTANISSSVNEISVDGVQPTNLLDSPLCLAYLLAFYDHLCLWEEDSVVPVLHVGWVDKLMASLTRFSAAARSQLHVEATRGKEDEDTPATAAPTTPSLLDNHHRHHHPVGAVVTRSSAIRGTAPSPLPVAVEEEEQLHDKRALRVILPPASASMSFQSPSTTSSSAPSMFTPVPSGGRELCQTLSHSRTILDPPDDSKQGSLIAAQQPPGAPPPPSCPTKPVLHSDEEILKDDFLDSYVFSVDASFSKDELISRLARASQFRLLNPAFLMGDLSASPFVSPEELDAFLIEKEPAEGDQDKLHPASTVSLTEDQKKQNHEVGLDVDAATDSTVGPRRSFSPESSACPSLSSIPPTPPTFPLPASPVGALHAAAEETARDHVDRLKTSPLRTPESLAKEVTSPTGLASKSALLNPNFPTPPPSHQAESVAADDVRPPGVYLRLFSAKMSRIAKLLTAPGCLKSSAIKLTLTAQSEVNFTRRRASTMAAARWKPHNAAATADPPSSSYRRPAPATG
uniref:Menin n=1 Tax=Mesocestoides corti TaxID=53468 RepID=A0A5K3F5H8_MESCO